MPPSFVADPITRALSDGEIDDNNIVDRALNELRSNCDHEE